MVGVPSFNGDAILGLLAGEFKSVGSIFAKIRLDPFLLAVAGSGGGWPIITVFLERGIEAKCLPERNNQRIRHIVSVKLRKSVVIGI